MKPALTYKRVGSADGLSTGQPVEPAPEDIVTFGITLASQKSVADWAHTLSLLQKTLQSIENQSDQTYRVLICGHERPDIPEIEHDAVEFLAISSRRPTVVGQFRRDKRKKRHVLGMRLRELGGGYFMQLDADDLVHRNLVHVVRSGNSPAGFIVSRGYAYDWANDRLAPVPGVWGVDLDRVCGSCAIIRYDKDTLPEQHTSDQDTTLLYNMTRMHGYIRVVMEELGTPLEDMPIPAVVYVVNHSQNLSFMMQKSGERGDGIIDKIARHALPEDRVHEVKRDFALA